MRLGPANITIDFCECYQPIPAILRKMVLASKSDKQNTKTKKTAPKGDGYCEACGWLIWKPA